MIIGIDFDGTIVEHSYPDIGSPIHGALDTMRELLSLEHKIILFTMRSGKELEEAVKYLEDEGINLFGVNENPSQKSWTQSPKPYCHIYIDDAALGCPLHYRKNARAAVDWKGVTHLLIHRGVLV